MPNRIQGSLTAGSNAAQGSLGVNYEIARYGSLITWAKQLGRNDCASVLQKTLDEEKATDKKLTALAEGKVNLKAASLFGAQCFPSPDPNTVMCQ